MIIVDYAPKDGPSVRLEIEETQDPFAVLERIRARLFPGTEVVRHVFEEPPKPAPEPRARKTSIDQDKFEELPAELGVPTSSPSDLFAEEA